MGDKGTKKQVQLLKPLPSDVRSIVRSGLTITSLAQCVKELVYNSVDAGAKNLFISLNTDLFNVRIDDDGVGFLEADLEVVGNRYTTSKCHSVEDLANLRFYGYRGEALASIVEVSGTVDIITRNKDVRGVELRKMFKDGKVSGFVEKHNCNNESSGTSIIVGRLLSKLPVRQNRIDKNIQIEEVKRVLESIVLINPSLNLKLINEKGGIRVFEFSTTGSYSLAFDQLYQQRLGFQVNFMEEFFLFRKLFFSLCISNEWSKKKDYQIVFVNNRFIQRCRIHKWVKAQAVEAFKEVQNGSPKTDKYPIFILNITCPLSEYDITIEPKKEAIEFMDWESVQAGIEGLMTKFKARQLGQTGSNYKKHSIKDKINVSTLSSFDVKTAIHSRFIARGDSSTTGEQNLHGSQSNAGRSKTRSSQKAGTRASLPRSAKSNRIMNVREIRKRKKCPSTTFSKDFVPPPKCLQSFGRKPQLTMNIFKKFPQWKNEFDQEKPSTSSSGIPSKKFKKSEVEGDGHGKEPPATSASNPQRKIGSALSDDEKSSGSTDPPSSEKSNILLSESSRKLQQQLAVSQAAYDKVSNLNSSVVAGPSVKSKASLPEPSRELKEWLAQSYSDDVGSPSSADSTPSVKSDALLSASSRKLQEQLNQSFRSDVKNLSFIEAPLSVKSSKSVVLSQSSRKSHEQLAQSFHSIKNSSAIDLFVPLKSNVPLPQSSRKLEEPMVQSFQCDVQNSSSVDPAPKSDLHLSESSKKLEEEFSQLFGGDVRKSSLVEPAPFLKPNLPVPGPSWKLQEDFSQSFFRDIENPSLGDPAPFIKSAVSLPEPTKKPQDLSEDSDLFPLDWQVEIVSDAGGQEWLQSIDANGKTVYINLSTGESASSIVHVFGTLRKVSAGDMKKSNPVKYNWLRKHFPQGFRQFWNGSTREVCKNGDLSKIGSSLIGDSVRKCVRNQDQDSSKWRDGEPESFSQYFTSEGQKELPVNRIGKSALQSATSTSANEMPFWKNFATGTSSIRFKREDFKYVNVIGQYDQKFILASVRSSMTVHPTLVIFDQHAVDERIRLERLTEESLRISKSTGKKCIVQHILVPPLPLHLSEGDIRILKKCKELFVQHAIDFELSTRTSIKIKSVPRCFYEHARRKPAEVRDSTLLNLIHYLLQELIQHIMDTKRASFTGVPKTIHDILCSQACHGAIKFGDPLDLSSCQKMIQDLSACKNLYQCAHGRPSVVPLIKANDLVKTRDSHFNWDHQLHLDCYSDHTSLQNHEECSKHFCNAAAKTDNDSLPVVMKDDSEKKDATSTHSDPLLDAIYGVNLNEDDSTESKSKETKGIDDVVDDDEEGSPYFRYF